MTKKDYVQIASEIRDAAYDLTTKRVRTSGQSQEFILNHFRMVVIVGISLRRTNEHFDARQWVDNCIPDFLRKTASPTFQAAVDAIDAKSLRVWNEGSRV